MPAEDLRDTFGISTLDQSEFQQVLLDYFHSAQGVSPTEIAYPGHATDHALRLAYKGTQLVAIAPGPRLTEADVRAIQERVDGELRTSHGMRIGRAFLFTAVPVTGTFRYNDRFQILPVPADAPRPPDMLGDQPFLCEFAFRSSPNFTIGVLRRAILSREYELLLNVLLEFRTHSLGNTARRRWVYPRDASGPFRSECLQEGYHWPEARYEDSAFTDATGFPALVTRPTNEYYTRLQGISVGATLELPVQISELIERFLSLATASKERFLRAAFWFHHAGRVTWSPSAAFTALISAVEALMPPEESRAQCVTCGRQIGKGQRRRFIELVERLAPGSRASDRARFYSTRSALSHGGSLLLADLAAWRAGFSPADSREWADSRSLFQLARIVLVNWLLSSP